MRLLRAYFTSFFIIAWTFSFSFVAILSILVSPNGGIYLTFARVWARVIFYVGGISYKSHVDERFDPQVSYLYVANHESLTDILALYATMPQKLVMVAKRSLLILPVWSWGMWLAGFVFINRKNRAAAYRSMEKAGRRLKKGRSVLVFPEGTRGPAPDDSLQMFKRGGFVLAQAARIPIVPVAIAGTRKVLPRDHFPVNPGHIAVCVGAPIPPPDENIPLEPFIETVRAEVDRLRTQARSMIPKEFV